MKLISFVEYQLHMIVSILIEEFPWTSQVSAMKRKSKFNSILRVRHFQSDACDSFMRDCSISRHKHPLVDVNNYLIDLLSLDRAQRCVRLIAATALAFEPHSTSCQEPHLSSYNTGLPTFLLTQ